MRLLLCLALVSCGRSSSQLPKIDWDQGPVPVIEGDWILRLETESQGKLGDSSPKVAEGTIQLRCQESVSQDQACPVNYRGTYDEALASLFGPPLDRALIGVATPQGLVELATNVNKDHGSYRLRGMMRHDSVIGEWEVTGYVPGSRGRFVMRRP